jgi:ABC-type transporter Mla maintaining outer membrane lipid asymmetry permease subunit MlaE
MLSIPQPLITQYLPPLPFYIRHFAACRNRHYHPVCGAVFREGFQPPYEVQEFLCQCYAIGYQSLPPVGTTGFIMGLVLTLRLRPTRYARAYAACSRARRSSMRA